MAVSHSSTLLVVFFFLYSITHEASCFTLTRHLTVHRTSPRSPLRPLFTSIESNPIEDATLITPATEAAAPVKALLSPKQAIVSLLAGQTDPVLCCPVSLEPLLKTERYLGVGVPQEKWTCAGFGTSYSRTGPYVDLVPSPASSSASRMPWERSLQELVQVDTFRNPLVAFLYERGWRQGFANAGFPGIDAEFDLLLDFFRGGGGDSPSVMNGVLLDMSCGSGLMTRRLAAHGTANRLFAGDFSEVMLLETSRRIAETGSGSTAGSTAAKAYTAPELVRCDVAKLPFATGSVSGCHAGAALHCWPDLEAGLAEVCRVLQPGTGRFFATTFKKGAYGVPRQMNENGGASFRFFDVEELEGLLRDAGFTTVDVELVGAGCLVARCTV